MSTSAKTNRKEVINISIVWIVLSLVAALNYTGFSFILSLIAFMLPLGIYIWIAYKFGSGYIIEKISENDIIKTAFKFFDNMLKINNIDKDVIKGSATKKSRIMLISVISLFAILVMLSSVSFDVKIAILMLYLPLFYPILKGYKLAIIALIAIKFIDVINTIIGGGNLAINIFMLIVLGSVYLYALYVENLRAKLIFSGKISAEKSFAKRDTFITIGLYLLFIALMFITVVQ